MLFDATYLTASHSTAVSQRYFVVCHNNPATVRQRLPDRALHTALGTVARTDRTAPTIWAPRGVIHHRGTTAPPRHQRLRRKRSASSTNPTATPPASPASSSTQTATSNRGGEKPTPRGSPYSCSIRWSVVHAAIQPRFLHRLRQDTGPLRKTNLQRLAQNSAPGRAHRLRIGRSTGFCACGLAPRDPAAEEHCERNSAGRCPSA